MRILRLTSMSIILLTSAIIVWAGGRREPAHAMSIAVPFSVSSIPLLELDGAEIAGAKISVNTFKDHTLVLAEFTSGKIDILMTGFAQGVRARAGNAAIRHLVTPVWGVSSLVAADPSVTKTGHLAGKTIIVPFRGSPLDLQLRAILTNAGIIDKVTIEHGPIQQAIPLLLAGRCDAIAVPEPFPSQLAAGGKAHRIFTFADAWAGLVGGDGRSPQVSLFVGKGFIDSHAAFITGLVDRITVKTKATADDPKAMAAKYAKLFETDPSIVEEGIRHTLFDVPAFDASVALCTDYLAKTDTAAPAGDFYLEY
jgi:ABC-type nitrate/sulfonate/bicarbonate transport system substrate-binding protein